MFSLSSRTTHLIVVEPTSKPIFIKTTAVSPRVWDRGNPGFPAREKPGSGAGRRIILTAAYRKASDTFCRFRKKSAHISKIFNKTRDRLKCTVTAFFQANPLIS